MRVVHDVPRAICSILLAVMTVACGEGSQLAVPARGWRVRDDGAWHAVRLEVALAGALYRGIPVGYEIVLPRRVTSGAPLVVLPAHPLHGLRMRYFLEHLQHLGGNSPAVMFVHGPNVAFARSNDRYRRLLAEPSSQSDARAIALAAIEDGLQRFPWLAQDRVSCLGWSGSANSCWELAIHAPRRIAAIDVISSGFNPTTPGADFDKLRCTAVRIEHGERDTVIARERPVAAAARLRSIGADVTLVMDKGAGHSDQSDAKLAAAMAWLARQRLRVDCLDGRVPR